MWCTQPSLSPSYSGGIGKSKMEAWEIQPQGASQAPSKVSKAAAEVFNKPKPWSKHWLQRWVSTLELRQNGQQVGN